MQAFAWLSSKGFRSVVDWTLMAYIRPWGTHTQSYRWPHARVWGLGDWWPQSVTINHSHQDKRTATAPCPCPSCRSWCYSYLLQIRLVLFFPQQGMFGLFEHVSRNAHSCLCVYVLVNGLFACVIVVEGDWPRQFVTNPPVTYSARSKCPTQAAASPVR